MQQAPSTSHPGADSALRVALVVNSASGSHDEGAAEGALRAAGANVTVFPLERLAEAAATSCARVVVAGGDGSVQAAAHHAALQGVPLAVLPTGTANDFARA